MSDFISAARIVGQFAASVAAMAGHAAHRTAVDNARSALAEAHRRAAERREVEALLAQLTRASAPPVTAVDTPVRTAVQ